MEGEKSREPRENLASKARIKNKYRFGGERSRPFAMTAPLSLLLLLLLLLLVVVVVVSKNDNMMHTVCRSSSAFS